MSTGGSRFAGEPPFDKFPGPVPASPTVDPVNPSYYHGDECMRVIVRATKGCGNIGSFCCGQAIKYMWRAGRKTGEDGATDVKKAQWYLKWAKEHIDGDADATLRLIKRLEDILGYVAPEVWLDRLRGLG